MSARLKRNWHLLHVLDKAKPQQRKAILKTANNDLVIAICEIVDNVLRGTVKLTPAQRKKLRRYKSALRILADKKICCKDKKGLVIQNGGFLPLVLAPALSVAAGILGEVIGKAIR